MLVLFLSLSAVNGLSLCGKKTNPISSQLANPLIALSTFDPSVKGHDVAQDTSIITFCCYGILQKNNIRDHHRVAAHRIWTL